jgi:parvulin-like peptidyl-prolyl isomerase
MAMHQSTSPRVALLTALVLTVGVGCGILRERENASNGGPVGADVRAQQQLPVGVVGPLLAEPYPRARWRLASQEELARTTLWVSHILIRHEGVRPGIVTFQLGDWTPAPAAPTRTRQEAFELAQKVAAQLQSAPTTFDAVARQVSEDIATKERGGSLGGVCALELNRRYANVLDALAATRPGEMSRVVETPYGFHIFLRRAPPPEERVSGAHIVIGYDEAPWLKAFLARREVPARPRAKALELADAVYARAKSGESWEALVDEYSDHEDAVRQGDFGEWSTHERTPFPVEVEALQQLAVGEVARPIDGPFGVKIIKRMPNRPRTLYAMSTVEQTYNFYAYSPTEPDSRPSVLRNMQRLAADVLGDPSKFDAFQRDYCCKEGQQWAEGRGAAFVERALSALDYGQISPEPVSSSGAYAIVKRQQPQPTPAPAPLLELPAPDKPDLRYLASMAQLNYRLPVVGKLAAEQLGLEGDTAAEFVRIHVAAGPDEEAGSGAEGIARFEAFLQKVRELVGQERFGRYSELLTEHFEELLLAPKTDDAQALAPRR